MPFYPSLETIRREQHGHIQDVAGLIRRAEIRIAAWVTVLFVVDEIVRRLF